MRASILFYNCFTASGCFVLFAALVACGGGGGGNNTGSVTSPTPGPTPTPAPTLARLFASLAPDGGNASFKYLKACHFPTQQYGTAGQAGITFLESLVVETLPTRVPLYNAQTGESFVLTTRAYKGSNPATGAPPLLWTGVFKANADGSISGFGAPCTPTTMVTAPEFTCYWLGENGNAQSLASSAFFSQGDTRPQTSSGAASLINPGWGTGTGFYFWYEMSFGGNCSAPGSKTVWRGPPKDAR